ncbi:hypothetical protein ACFV6D_38655 [Kitasatospora sp. NPDC059812]|uniref:hypothetical protein n=1 Tax=Kitasatospora sp. NPDC059812 TaxID=3346958 RepID=UPI003666A1EA
MYPSPPASPARRSSILCVATACACILALSAAAPASQAKPDAAEPACSGASGKAMAVTGGTVIWCAITTAKGKAGGRLTYKNTGRALGNLSLVVYDCDGGKAPNSDVKKCSASMKSMADIMWVQIDSDESVYADFDIAKGSNAQVWWTSDKPGVATDLKLLGTPWNS